MDYGEIFYKMANEKFAQHPRFKGKGPRSALGPSSASHHCNLFAAQERCRIQFGGEYFSIPPRRSAAASKDVGLPSDDQGPDTPYHLAPWQIASSAIV